MADVLSIDKNIIQPDWEKKQKKTLGYHLNIYSFSRHVAFTPQKVWFSEAASVLKSFILFLWCNAVTLTQNTMRITAN